MGAEDSPIFFPCRLLRENCCVPRFSVTVPSTNEERFFFLNVRYISRKENEQRDKEVKKDVEKRAVTSKNWQKTLSTVAEPGQFSQSFINGSGSEENALER